MRILELAMYSPDFLGSFGDSLLSLGRELKRNKDSMVVCFPEFKDWTRVFEDEGFPIEILPIRNVLDFGGVNFVLNLIKKYKIDIMHTHFWLKSQVVACLAKTFSSREVKVIWHWRSPPRTDVEGGEGEIAALQKIKRAVGNWGYRILDNLCVSVHVCNSDYIYDILQSRRIGRKGKVKIIYNGVDIDKYNPGVVAISRGKHGISPDEILIGNISNFTAQKDHFTFLDAAETVLEKYPKVKFMLVGDGPTKPQVESYAHAIGISSSLIFTGMQQDVRGFIKTCNFTVLASLHEGFGNVVCESMALERPVIGTEVGGIPGIVKDGETGFLVPRKDSKAMAERISYLIEHPEEVERLGKNGRKLVEKRFTTSRWARDVRTLFLEVLESPYSL